MALKPRLALLADDIRREDNGKLIILGFYPAGIVVPQLPYTFPMLTFYLEMECDRAGDYHTNLVLEFVETGRKLAEVPQSIRVGNSNLPLVGWQRILGLTITQAGSYSIHVFVNGEVAPIVDFPFEVNLQQPS